MVGDGEVERRLEGLSPRQREEFLRLLRDRRRSGSVSTVRPERAGGRSAETVVRMREGTDGTPIVFVHSANGTVLPYFRLSEALAAGPAVYGLQAPGIDRDGPVPNSLPEIVDAHVAAVHELVGSGPCHLVGWSAGGVLAYALACALRATGTGVDRLVLLDSLPPEGLPTDRAALLAYLTDSFALTLGHLPPGLDPDELGRHAEPARLTLALDALVGSGCVQENERGAALRRLRVGLSLVAAGAGWSPPPYDGDLHLVTADDGVPGPEAVALWGAHVRGRILQRSVPGDHYGMMRPPASSRLAEVLVGIVHEAGPHTATAHHQGVQQ
ncbi:thioesterase domain-containing protein [Nocardiopsis terrae]